MKKTRQRASKSERTTRRKAKKVEAKLTNIRSKTTKAEGTLSTVTTACKKAEAAQEKAAETTKLILDDAHDKATKVVRRSRKRAIREANARKVEAERMLNISEAKRKVEETAAQHAREEALSAQNLLGSATTQTDRCVKQAQIATESAARERDNLTAATAELKQTEKRRDIALKDTAEAQKAATKATADRNARLARTTIGPSNAPYSPPPTHEAVSRFQPQRNLPSQVLRALPCFSSFFFWATRLFDGRGFWVYDAAPPILAFPATQSHLMHESPRMLQPTTWPHAVCLRQA